MDADERALLERGIDEACGAARWSEAATLAIRGYGPEILGYLLAIGGREQDASEAFSIFCEALWRGLPGFRRESSLRTWAYRLAQRAVSRVARNEVRRKRLVVAIDGLEIEAIAEEVRTATLPYLRAEMQAHIAKLREDLEPEDRALLVLRIDRRLTWESILRILRDEDLEGDAVTRGTAALRKRYERLKVRLRERARALVPPE